MRWAPSASKSNKPYLQRIPDILCLPSWRLQKQGKIKCSKNGSSFIPDNHRNRVIMLQKLNRDWLLAVILALWLCETPKAACGRRVGPRFRVEFWWWHKCLATADVTDNSNKNQGSTTLHSKHFTAGFKSRLLLRSDLLLAILPSCHPAISPYIYHTSYSYLLPLYSSFLKVCFHWYLPLVLPIDLLIY